MGALSAHRAPQPWRQRQPRPPCTARRRAQLPAGPAAADRVAWRSSSRPRATHAAGPASSPEALDAPAGWDALFQQADADGNGLVDLGELRGLLEASNRDLAPEILARTRPRPRAACSALAHSARPCAGLCRPGCHGQGQGAGRGLRPAWAHPAGVQAAGAPEAWSHTSCTRPTPPNGARPADARHAPGRPAPEGLPRCLQVGMPASGRHARMPLPAH